MGLRDRLDRLEESMIAKPQPEDWPIEDQLEAVLDELWLHRAGRYQYAVLSI